jgi:hypothetical protein
MTDGHFGFGRIGDHNTDVMTRSVWVDEGADSAHLVNNAVNDRNALVEVALDVNIVLAHRVNMGALTGYLAPQFISGITNYEIVQGNEAFAVANILNAGRGHWIDYNSLAPEESGLHINQPWWDASRIEISSHAGRAFFLTGHISQSWVASMFVSFVNMSMWTDIQDVIAPVLNTMAGGHTDIYEIVRHGYWTLPFLTAIGNIIYENRDGADAITANDRVGFVTFPSNQGNFHGRIIMMGTDHAFVRTNEQGQIVENMTSPRAIEMMDAMYNLWYNGSSFQARTAGGAPVPGPFVLDLFAEGNALFTVHMLHMIEAHEGLRSMEGGFHILPLPKLNTAQEFYTTAVHDNVGVFMIPAVHRNDALLLTLVLERMAFLAYDIITPRYYDTALPGFFSPGEVENVREMLALGRDNLSICFGSIWGGSRLSPLDFFFRDSSWANFPATVAQRSIAFQVNINTLVGDLNIATSAEFFD